MNRYAVFLGTMAVMLGTVAIVFGGSAVATPPSGLAATPLAAGDLAEPIALTLGHDHERAEGEVETDVAKISVVQFALEPGGTFGWHEHGGPVWAVVASGTLSLYAADGATCESQEFGAGSAFLDIGNHTHMARNEGDEPVEIYAAFMLPEGGEPRVDVPDPGSCPA